MSYRVNRENKLSDYASLPQAVKTMNRLVQ